MEIIQEFFKNTYSFNEIEALNKTYKKIFKDKAKFYKDKDFLYAYRQGNKEADYKYNDDTMKLYIDVNPYKVIRNNKWE